MKTLLTLLALACIFSAGYFAGDRAQVIPAQAYGFAAIPLIRCDTDTDCEQKNGYYGMDSVTMVMYR